MSRSVWRWNHDLGGLLRRYSGRNAQTYEAKRQGRKWAAEAQAFQVLLDRVKPRTVLDCPVGTGRWIDLYRRGGASVLGVDISRDMLAEAARKAPADAAIRLEAGDVLSPDGVDLGRGHDLIVCTRFVQWLRPDELPALMRRFSATGARHLLISARVAPGSAAQARRLPARRWTRLLKLLKAPFRGHALRHLHSEAHLLGSLQKAGWKLVHKQRVLHGRGYSFYLLVAVANLSEGRLPMV